MSDLALRIMLSAQDTASKVVKDLGGTLDGLGKNAGGAGGQLGGLGNVLSKVGGVAGVVVGTLEAVGGKAVDIGVKATEMAADYEQSMNKVQALTGASTDQMKQFDGGLKQLSMDTGVVPKQLSEGLYNVVSAGYQGKDAMTMLGLATKDSVIGMTDAATTTKSLSALLAQFSLGAKDATRTNGEMLETVTLGSGTFEQYASNIVKSASAASQFHVSMETMNAAYATLTSSQITAGNASTDFQQSLKVMDGNIGTVTKSLNKSGIAFDETKFNAMDYGHQVSYLNTALEEANAKHVKVTGVTLQASQAISTIAQHIDVYNKDLSTLSDKQAMAQKTQEAWAVTAQGFNVSMQRLQATMQVVMIDIGQRLLPIATGGVNLLNNAFQGLMSAGTYVGNVLKTLNLSDFKDAWQSLKSTVVDVGQAFQVLGSRLNPIVGDFDPLAEAIQRLAQGGLNILTGMIWKAYVAISAISEAITSGKGPLADLGNVFSQLGPPLKTLANAIGGELGHEFQLLGQDAQQFGSWFMSSVMPAIQQAMPGFLNLAKTILDTVLPAFITIRGIIVDFIQHALETFGPIIGKIVPPLIKFAGVLANDVANGLKFIIPYVLQAAKAIGDFANDIMTRVAPIIKQWIGSLTPLVEAFMKEWATSWPMVESVLKGVWDGIVGIVKIAWALVSGIIKIGLDIMSGNWGQAWNDLKDMLSGVWDGIKTYVKGGIEALIGLFKPMLEAMSHIPGPAGDMARGVLNAFGGMTDGAAQKTADMKTKVLENTASMHMEAASHLDKMRQDILEQIKNTTDTAKKHALEMKLGVVTHAEEMHVDAAHAAEKMAKDVPAHVKNMHDQVTKSGIAGIAQWFGDRFTDAKNAVTGAFGTVGRWFQDRWKDIQNIWGGVGKFFQDRWTDISNAWKTGVDKVTGFFTYLYDHSTLFQKIVDAIHNAFTTAVTFIQNVWKTVSGWVVSEWNSLVGHAKDLWNKVSKAVSDGWSAAVKWVQDTWKSISDTFSSAWSTYVSGPLTALWKTVSTFFSNVWTNYVATPISNFWKSISTTFSNAWQDHVSKPISDLWTSISTTVSGWATSAWQWGVNLITGLANGITNAVKGALNTALTGAATAIKNVVGWHSPTKEGPGSDSDTWAPNLVKMMSTGLVEGVPQIEQAVNKLAKPIAMTLGVTNSGALNSLGGVNLKSGTPLQGGSTTNNSGGGTTNQTFNINITVPQGRIDRAGAQQIAKAVKDELSRELRGSGKLTTWTSGGAI